MYITILALCIPKKEYKEERTKTVKAYITAVLADFLMLTFIILH